MHAASQKQEVKVIKQVLDIALHPMHAANNDSINPLFAEYTEKIDGIQLIVKCIIRKISLVIDGSGG